MRWTTRLKAFFRTPRYPLFLLLAFAVWFGLWAIRPSHPQDFFLEHILTVAAVGTLVWTRRWLPLSHLSYTLLFIFLALHVIGAHYTYAEVPYEAWARQVAGWLGVEGFDLRAACGFTRNHYDRLIHFAFGLLCAYPVRELFVRVARVRGFWSYYFPFDVAMSLSMLYELLEWAVAVIVAGDVGQSYLGTQGDEWDAHKDMALATLGALIAIAATACCHWRLRRDFAAEMADSLKVHDPRPLEEGR